jgi:hypothetical protein
MHSVQLFITKSLITKIQLKHTNKQIIRLFNLAFVFI